MVNHTVKIVTALLRSVISIQITPTYAMYIKEAYFTIAQVFLFMPSSHIHTTRLTKCTEVPSVTLELRTKALKAKECCFVKLNTVYLS